ncbi:MAG: hypothetical protein Q9211_006813 [Gyalolechia sp. 1 TL-2023]
MHQRISQHQGQMTSQTNQDDNRQCPVCTEVFISSSSKEDHIQRSNCGSTCKLCRKIFSGEIDLRDHWKTAHARCYCSICDKLCISRQARVYHERHQHFRCKPCERMFATKEEWKDHTETYFHYIPCSKCNDFVREFNGEWTRHRENCPGPSKDSKEKANFQHPQEERAKSETDPKPKEECLPDGIPDFYGYLKIDPWSTQADIIQAARKRRVEVHPDKLKKAGMSEEEVNKIDQVAMQVGWAADVLLNLETRLKYDRELADYFSRRKY